MKNQRFKYLANFSNEQLDIIESELGPAFIACTFGVKTKTKTKTNNFVFEWDDVKSGAYLGVDFSTIPSVDIELLTAMAECERIFLKMADRLLPGSSYQQRKDQYLRHLRFWSWQIPSDLEWAFFGNVPHEGFDFIIYSLCKLRRVKTLVFYTLPIRPYKSVLMHAMVDIFNPGTEIALSYERMLSSKDNTSFSVNDLSAPLQSYLIENQDVQNEMISFTRAENQTDLGLRNLKRIILRAIDLVINLQFKQFFISFLDFLVRLFLGPNAFFHFRYRDAYFDSELAVNKFYTENISKPDLTRPYIYLALHFQPECSTSPLGGDFVDQALVCEMLSWASGNDFLIYVKEHPRKSKSLFVRNIEFYKRLLEARNVLFIDRDASSYELIDNSFAVATVTGSVGWEAFLRGKPVLMFGSRFYETAPGVFKIRKNNELIEVLSTLRSKKFVADRENIIRYLKALEINVFEGFIADQDEIHATVSRELSNRNILAQISKFVNH